MINWITRRLWPAKVEKRAGINFDRQLTLPTHSAGMTVNEQHSLGIAALYRALDITASKFASLPIEKYRVATDGTKEKVIDSTHYLLNCEPNELYPAYHLKHTLCWNALLHGNGLAWIYRDENGLPTALYSLNPYTTILRYYRLTESISGWVWQTTVYFDRDGNAISTSLSPMPVSLSGAKVELVFIPISDMFVLRALGDSLVGFSTLDLMKKPLGEAMALQEHTNTSFSNGLTSSQAIVLPPGMNDADDIENFRDQLEGRHQGSRKAFRALLLRHGATLGGSISLTNQQAELFKMRNFSVQQISAITGVPTHFLGMSEGVSQFGVQEQKSQDFLTYTLDKWLDSAEAEAYCKFLSESEKASGQYEYCFDRKRAIKMDRKTANDILVSDWTNGFRNKNECRAELGLPPVEDGDVYYVPTTVQPEEMALEPPPPPAPVLPPGDNGQAEDKQEPKKDDRAAIVQATVKRLMTRVRKSVESRNGKKDFSKWLDSSFEEYHRQVFIEALSPIMPDADVASDQLLADMRDEIRAVCREDVPKIWTRYAERLLSECNCK